MFSIKFYHDPVLSHTKTVTQGKELLNYYVVLFKVTEYYCGILINVDVALSYNLMMLIIIIISL